MSEPSFLLFKGLVQNRLQTFKIIQYEPHPCLTENIIQWFHKSVSFFDSKAGVTGVPQHFFDHQPRKQLLIRPFRLPRVAASSLSVSPKCTGCTKKIQIGYELHCSPPPLSVCKLSVLKHQTRPGTAENTDKMDNLTNDGGVHGSKKYSIYDVMLLTGF